MQQKSRESYTRVTHILEPFSGLHKVNPEILQFAADRGTLVHKICEGIMSGIGEIGVTDQVAGYVESFKKWWDTTTDVIDIERRFWCDDLQVTGQVDLMMRTPEGIVIIDLKTSSKPNLTWRVQASGYTYLATKAGYDVKFCRFLHLDKFGKTPKLIDYPADPSLFLATYMVHQHFFGPKHEK